jgi:putative oxygen-independent coproporphyrinogen III oxidase
MKPALQIPPLSLYVHFPWCIEKCPYCDFNSHPLREALPQQDYVDRLIVDLDGERPRLEGRPIRSIFFGGGTPSLFAPESFDRLLDAIRRRAVVADDAEITLEANPGAVDRRHFAGYRAAGINRLSIGAQSFDPLQLRALGRIHGPADIDAAVEAAHDAGFERINLDLMHGLPGQSPAAAVADLDAAIARGVDHVSWYQLTIEAKTTFARRPPRLPDEETLAAIEAGGFARLHAAGFQRYEVSAFARPGQASRHNLNYWQFGDYVGIGAGAHGKWTDPAAARIERIAKPAQPRRYLATTPYVPSETREIVEADRAGEFMLNALRLLDGVPAGSFEPRTGVPLANVMPALSRLRARELLVADPGRIATTETGLRYLDSVVAEFL